MWPSIACSGHKSVYDGGSDIPILVTSDVERYFRFHDKYVLRKENGRSCYLCEAHTANLHHSCQEYRHIDRI